MACVGMPTLPDRFDPEVCDRVARAFAARGLTMAAVSGTFNMAHPDPLVRRAGLEALHPLALSCTLMDARSSPSAPAPATRGHVEAASRQRTTSAWRDLSACLREALAIVVGVRPDARLRARGRQRRRLGLRARRLLDEIASPHLKVVIDPANLFHAGELPRMREILDEAFDLLGPEIVLAHAKDLSRDGEAGPRGARGPACSTTTVTSTS